MGTRAKLVAFSLGTLAVALETWRPAAWGVLAPGAGAK
jgi:hypothetical protein